VLIVEDDPFTAIRLHRLLVSRGVTQVVLATTVAEALELLEAPPNWVILDMNLPDGLGLVVLQAYAKLNCLLASSCRRRRRMPN
jgi:ActR/RegA family two-component response regulator